MGNCIKAGDAMIFHPGYYVEELIREAGGMNDSSGITVFAGRLGITPAQLDLLVRGKLDISLGLAEKLADVSGTSRNYWISLQERHDAAMEKTSCFFFGQ